MEIRDYVRVKRRWLIPLIVVPVIAAAVTVVLLGRQPAEYTAQVQLLTPASAGHSDSSIGLYAANLSQALQVDSVVNDLARRSRVTAGDIRQGLVVNRIGSSDQVRVAFTGTGSEERALLVAKDAAAAGVVFVASRAGSNAQRDLDAAQKALTDAQNALYAFQDHAGVADPGAMYQQTINALRSAQAGLPADQAVGNSIGVARDQAQIAALQQQADQLVPLVRQYTPLQAAVTAAISKVNNVRSQATDYQAGVAAAESGSQVVQSSVSAVGRRRTLIEGAGLAAVVAFFVVLGVSLIPDLFRRQGHRVPDSVGERSNAEVAVARPNGKAPGNPSVVVPARGREGAAE